MAPTPTYDLIDRVLGGQLGQKLAAWRAEGETSKRTMWVRYVGAELRAVPEPIGATA